MSKTQLLSRGLAIGLVGLLFWSVWAGGSHGREWIYFSNPCSHPIQVGGIEVGSIPAQSVLAVAYPGDAPTRTVTLGTFKVSLDPNEMKAPEETLSLAKNVIVIPAAECDVPETP